MSGSFDTIAVVTASTKRQGAVNAETGLVGDMIESVASLKCTPLDPVDEKTRQQAGFGTFVELKQTFVRAGVDIKEGDTFTVGTITYRIKAVAEWYWSPTADNTMQVFLMEVK